MKTVSIKVFILLMTLALFISENFIFYNFYQNFKTNLSEVLKDDLQATIINLNHFVRRNLKINNVSNVISHLDNLSASSKIIQDIYLLDNTNKLLYSTNKDNTILPNNEQCSHISEIQNIDIFSHKCYTFSFRLYDGLTPHYYHNYVLISSTYIHSILIKEAQQYLFVFIIFAILFIVLVWYILKHILISPLEQLRQYAYYSEHQPKKFIISEIESIRYSLQMTFTRLQKEQQELFELSTYDSLSGLYNRLSLMEKITWLISSAKRSKSTFAVIFFDLDDFKNINDAHGHEVGDAVLKETSKILLSCLRENDIVSRFGGDEFVIVLPQLEDETRVLDVIKRIQNKLLQPILYNDIKHTITASMGISLYPKDAQDISSLLKHADIAMYRSKELGKNKYSFFTNTLNNLLLERMKIQKTILNALENDYFKLYYQPKVDIVSGDITGCEALIRLIDPNEGLIPPDKFISIAEQNNLIIPIGEWVIKEATAQIKRWENSPLASLKVSINVSGVQFKDPTLLDVIQKAIQNIDCKKLDIELTESVLMHDFDTNLKTIEAFKALGLTLSLDDFGTGYSSLSYLKDIPFDTIKIDKSFVDDITTDTKALTFVQIIISIANNFSLEVVAEGVETQEQLKLLQEMECDIYQGYYMSRPLCVKEFEKLYISTQGT